MNVWRITEDLGPSGSEDMTKDEALLNKSENGFYLPNESVMAV